jgi:hypothetical protein
VADRRFSNVGSRFCNPWVSRSSTCAAAPGAQLVRQSRLDRLGGDQLTVPSNEGKGHRLGSQRRESSINQLLTAESRLLRCPETEENGRTCATFSSAPQRTRKLRTAWRRGGDSNPRDPFESTRVPGVRLKPGSATSPRANAIMHHANARGHRPQARLIAP